MGLEPFPDGVFSSVKGSYMNYVIFGCFCIHGQGLWFWASGKMPRGLAHLRANERDYPPADESENGIVNFSCLLRDGPIVGTEKEWHYFVLSDKFGLTRAGHLTPCSRHSQARLQYV